MQVVPDALRTVRLKPFRKYCRLGDLAAQVGWHHDDLIKRLEEKRKTRSAAFYETKKALNKIKAKATVESSKALADNTKALQALGYIQ